MRADFRTRAKPGELWLLAAVLFLAAAFFYQDPEWNGNSRLDLTRAIVEQGTLRIDSYHEAPDWATGDKARVGEHYYSDKAIGTSFLAVPVHWVLYQGAERSGLSLASSTIKHVLTTAVMGGCFLLAGLAMYLVACRLTADRSRALVATLALALGTMLWPYSAVFYGHVPAGAFLITAFYFLMAAQPATDEGYARRWFLAGLAVGLAFIADYTSAPVIVVLGVYAVHKLLTCTRPQAARAIAAAIVGALPSILLFVGYNVAVYGSPIAFGYNYEAEQRFQEIMGRGFMGMTLPAPGATFHITFDPRFGVFWLSPVLLLAVFGYIAAFRLRRSRAESLVSIFSIAVIFAMNAASYLWYGGSAFGPRLIIGALPFFIVPLTLLPKSLEWPLRILGAVSFAQMLIPLLGQIQYSRLEFRADKGGFFVAGKPFGGFSLLYEYGLPQIQRQLREGRSPWNLATALGLPFWTSVPILIAVEAALIWAWAKQVAAAPQSESE